MDFNFFRKKEQASPVADESSGLNVKQRLGSFFSSARRVLVISKKPSREEFFAMVKVTGLGIIVIAIIGYIVQLIFALTALGSL